MRNCQISFCSSPENNSVIQIVTSFWIQGGNLCTLWREFSCSALIFLSESFFMVKGAALFLQQGSSTQGPKTPTHHKHAGDLPQHLQVMFKILRSEDRIKLAVRLESSWTDRVRYMVVIYTTGHQDTEENVVLGMDFTDKDSKNCSIGMVLPLWSDTNIHLDGDGGFSVSTAGRSHVFKPVSVQDNDSKHRSKLVLE
uniref:Slingshot N-terminal domain-containing protein n=1 Tax=Oreochromis aureus TaxID=47969 RepID=A0AAZ1XIL9_OREAU